MIIVLKQLGCEHFKGLVSFEAKFDGKNAVITGANGTGKTTVFDMLLWLFFGKDSTGRKDFEVRPLDEQNQPIKGVVVMVGGLIEIDGKVHDLRKEHHEKVVKGRLRGFETLCWINSVPKKISEYAEYINKIIPEDSFKMLTNLKAFSEGLHWKDRRAALLDIAGDIGFPKGFDELLATLNGRTIDEYKKVLAEQKKRHEKARDEINPRIDEIQRGVGEYVGSDGSLEKSRKELGSEISTLTARRNGLLESEKTRQDKINWLNNLKATKAFRESELANDTTGMKQLLDEKLKIETVLAAKKQLVMDAVNSVGAQKMEIVGKNTTLNTHTSGLDQVRLVYTKASDTTHESVCYACEQPLPPDQVEANKEKRQAKLAEMTKDGNRVKKNVDACKLEIETLTADLKELQGQHKKAVILVKEVEEYKVKRFNEIDGTINSREPLKPDQDTTWVRLCDEIKVTESEIGPPVSDQFDEIENAMAAKSAEREEINKALAQADRIKQDKERIVELEKQEKELAQQIADIEKQLADIDHCKQAQSKMLEAAVNGRFKHVEFKLFDQLINGDLEECCCATFNGVPYPDMSTGQQIYCGIDIINVLSSHYGISVPLFIDHAESMTMPIEATSQVIKLYADANCDVLTVENKGELINVK